MANFLQYNSLTQTFRIAVPDGIPGVFVSKLRLFFKAKSDSLGIQIYLVGMKNGLPDVGKIIPNSLVTLDSEDVIVTPDGQTGTDFVFPRLVYLNAGQSYGFCVKPIGNSPDYDLWVGELGKRDIFNDKPIGSNPLVETAYFSGNVQRWAELLNQDIKFNLYRAKFKHTSGTLSLRNKNSEMLKLYNSSLASDTLQVRAGDAVYGWNDGVVNTDVSGTVTKFDTINNILYLKNSTGNFVSNTNVAFIRTGVDEGDVSSQFTGLIGVGRIDSTANNGLYDFPYHGVAPMIGTLNVPFTNAAFKFIGAVYNGTKYVQGKELDIQNKLEIEFNDEDGPRYVLGETEERSGANDLRTGTPSTNSSLIIKTTLSSQNDFISPAIDLQENELVVLRNLINNSAANEHTNSGNATAKYVSKVITLADGMEAEDLRVFISANKPSKTELHVYAKIWASDDPQSFDEKVWSKLTYENPGAVRNTNKPDEYLEYVYSFATSASLAGNAFAAFQSSSLVPVQYSSANSTGGTSGGPVYDDKFKKFAIKIVLTADNGYEYLTPKVNDLRVIALQV